MNSIKVKELKGGSLSSPKYTVELQHTGSGEKQIACNYEVLTKLIGSNDLLISLDTSLLNLPYSKRSAHMLEFLQKIRALGLEYRCSKVTSNSGRNLIGGILIGKSTQEDEQILAYIPNEIWSGSDLKKALPDYGVKYYITRERTDASKLFEDMNKMLDDEKLGYFRLILFSVVSMDSIGVFTNSMTLADIKNLLGLQ